VSKLLSGALILLMLPAAANAADITVAPIPSGGIVVHIDGDITLGDEKTFSALTISEPDKSLVWLTSAGGTLVTAFRIGMRIKELGLTTVVHTGGMCASSCAMIWMAGRHAIVERNSELIFHAPYDVRSPERPDPEGIQAMVGYLIDIAGLSEHQALALATAAPPTEGWAATEAVAHMLGFSPQVVPFVGAARACKAKFCLAVRSYAGIGIRLRLDKGVIKVAEVLARSPAEKVTIKADDVITQVNHEAVNGLTVEQVIKRIRGPANTNVVLTLTRKGQDKSFDLTVTREVVPLQASSAESSK
jgi:hypothetical protein